MRLGVDLKAGVDKPGREEARLNPTFREFALHYDMAALPARPGRPTDKGMVEAAVGAVQSRILLALRHDTFFSLDAMNGAIRRELDRLNDAPMASGESRRARRLFACRRDLAYARLGLAVGQPPAATTGGNPLTSGGRRRVDTLATVKSDRDRGQVRRNPHSPTPLHFIGRGGPRN